MQTCELGSKLRKQRLALPLPLALSWSKKTRKISIGSIAAMILRWEWHLPTDSMSSNASLHRCERRVLQAASFYSLGVDDDLEEKAKEYCTFVLKTPCATARHVLDLLFLPTYATPSFSGTHSPTAWKKSPTISSLPNIALSTRANLHWRRVWYYRQRRLLSWIWWNKIACHPSLQYDRFGPLLSGGSLITNSPTARPTPCRKMATAIPVIRPQSHLLSKKEYVIYWW